MLPVFLAFSIGLFTANVYWCWRLGHWDEMEEERLEEKVLAVSRGWDQRGKENRLYYRAGGETWGLDLRSNRGHVGLSSGYMLPWEKQSVGEQGVPAGLDSGEKQPTKRLEGEELCNPQET